jgi:hypothetical protein
MPRYFFDVFENLKAVERDDVGAEYASPEKARDAAPRKVPLMIGDRQLEGDRGYVAIQIRDEAGQYIFRASLTLLTRWLKPPAGTP